ncbi:unnamed protein product, partial [Rotaria sp. Silwood1]
MTTTQINNEGPEVIVKLVNLYLTARIQSDKPFLLPVCVLLALCPNYNYNCDYGSCNSPSSCYWNSGYQGTCCNSTITSGQCLLLSSASTTSWGGGFNNTFYGHENDVLNVSSATGKTLTVAACFYGINSATPGCDGSTVLANCLSMNVHLHVVHYAIRVIAITQLTMQFLVTPALG